ncbi:hypothetical protein KTT_36830 [Tengunoibacter tsumagoiensis]|uniref:Protein kinase domain-containing protein n=1 Tax=Tengunoibacter tsumagoiensis TaxID=2014871 RepID=A0A402A3V3_9CHLR|nr:hypothetical protein KTT_36830 [Tengunoibacter tsumagoiensis]
MQNAQVDNYEVISFIGAGSYGYVYKVREPNPLGRILALKVLRIDQFNEKAKASFFQEARRIATMQHPNILPVYNFGQIAESGQPYFVMEYAPQTILDLFLHPDGSRRLALAEELVPYIQQTADALQYVHSNGLVHQDVKPGNLLIGRNKQILLSDFGTTFYLGMQTHASLGEATGTAAYMPPEQWKGNPRRDSDQYALATCCYELLSGRTPFVYKRLEEMWNAHLKETILSPQQWNPRIPAEIVAVLLRALSKDYHQRYPSIIDFADNYAQAVKIAQQRYVCHQCGQQNRTGAQRCAFCGVEYDQRTCIYCQALTRFGQRCCSKCGRLTLPPDLVLHSPLVGTTVHQDRYTIQRVIKQSDETHILSAVATDAHNQEQAVFLKRWECIDLPLTQRAKDIAYYDQFTAPLARLHHPLLPSLHTRFAEGRYYYAIFHYIDGESLNERLQKLQRPLPEQEVLIYLNSLLNTLMVLEQQQPPLRHYDLSPANILLDLKRNRAMLSGFRIPPPPIPVASQVSITGRRTTRKLAVSPYLPIQESAYDQRTCLYSLAACMHHALTNVAPPHYPTYPPVRLLNPQVSAELERILSRALLEEQRARYQSYAEFKRALQPLL